MHRSWSSDFLFSSWTTMLLTLLLASTNLAPASAMLDCKRILVDDQMFDLRALQGPHSVVTSKFHPGPLLHFYNTTYTLDVCAFLAREKNVKGDECPNFTRVCAIEHFIRPDRDDTITQVIPIAGKTGLGADFEYEATRLSTSDSHGDAEKEGLRLVMKGGKLEDRRQQAVVEFICDPDRTGLEEEWVPEDRYIPGEGEDNMQLRDRSAAAEKMRDVDGDAGTPPEHSDGAEYQLKKPNAALIWNSYGPLASDKDLDVLRLTWYTKYACESIRSTPAADESNSWGFFTWMVILIFLATASYLIFGSWLNYHRYGARGWDLLPHGDTLRDLPVLMKDWIRRVLNTVQSSGNRGGYSAV